MSKNEPITEVQRIQESGQPISGEGRTARYRCCDKQLGDEVRPCSCIRCAFFGYEQYILGFLSSGSMFLLPRGEALLSAAK